MTLQREPSPPTIKNTELIKGQGQTNGEQKEQEEEEAQGLLRTGMGASLVFSR
jgi:hypothetical protein